MSIRFGYACLNVTLGRQGGFRSMIKRTWEKEGLPRASRLAVENTEILCGIIEWNNRNGISVYRMTSDLIPWASEYELEQLPDWRTIRSNLERAGDIAALGGQRLSFHPGQFNSLTSPRDHVVKNCVRDLRIHGEIMDAMRLPRTREAKINIHLGGAFGEKDAAMDRWCKNYELLPDSVKERITLENDDKASCYSVVDLHSVWRRVGVPTVFDFHHHKFCPGGLSERDALHLAASTWGSVRPVTHYSESASIREGRDAIPQAHSSFVDGPVSDWGLDIDCVVEAKAKELAVLQLTTGRDYEKKYDSLRGFTNDELNANNAREKEAKRVARAQRRSEKVAA
jgi:UV DNA damage endonuclease